MRLLRERLAAGPDAAFVQGSFYDQNKLPDGRHLTRATWIGSSRMFRCGSSTLLGTRRSSTAGLCRCSGITRETSDPMGARSSATRQANRPACCWRPPVGTTWSASCRGPRLPRRSRRWANQPLPAGARDDERHGRQHASRRDRLVRRARWPQTTCGYGPTVWSPGRTSSSRRETAKCRGLTTAAGSAGAALASAARRAGETLLRRRNHDAHLLADASRSLGMPDNCRHRRCMSRRSCAT